MQHVSLGAQKDNSIKGRTCPAAVQCLHRFYGSRLLLLGYAEDEEESGEQDVSSSGSGPTPAVLFVTQNVRLASPESSHVSRPHLWQSCILLADGFTYARGARFSC